MFCSATIASPVELATRLLGEDVAAVTRSGAPQNERRLLLWNPPVINPDLGLRASARSRPTASRAWPRALVSKSIVFARSRLMVEVLTKYLKDVFDRGPAPAAAVFAYRGGYLPTQRRETERRLRDGSIDCVISTSALELGVDIGSLDVCVLNGYPGSIAATWQRLGRAGRRNRTSLGVLVAGSEPLDQYIVRNPEFFLGASPEHARIDPTSCWCCSTTMLRGVRAAVPCRRAFRQPPSAGAVPAVPGRRGRGAPRGRYLALGDRCLSGQRGVAALGGRG